MSFAGLYFFLKFRADSPIDVTSIHLNYRVVDSTLHDTVRFEVQIIAGADSILGQMKKRSEINLTYTRRISKRQLKEIYELCLAQDILQTEEFDSFDISIERNNGIRMIFAIKNEHVFEKYFNRLFKIDKKTP
jgi:hypothetical protein